VAWAVLFPCLSTGYLKSWEGGKPKIPDHDSFLGAGFVFFDAAFSRLAPLHSLSLKKGVSSMNVYDCAHALAKAIKTSPEFKQFKKAGEKIQKDASAKKMLTDLRKAQLELQKQKMSGLEVAPDQEKRLSQMFEVVNLNQVVKEYMETEYRFSIILTDIQDIISRSMENIINAGIFAETEEEPPATKES
jgi:cell fate (sporulation/competence/biofilm development) regulator YlbF (YheA/YmcA/DUF963 family)